MSIALAANAGVETFTASYGSSAAPLTIGSSSFPVSLTLQKFDAALGHLSDVELILTGNGLLQASILNTGPLTAYSDAQVTASLALTAPGGAGPTVTLATTPVSGSIAAEGFLAGPVVSQTAMELSHVPSADYGD
jgi:hypothetical protein